MTAADAARPPPTPAPPLPDDRPLRARRRLAVFGAGVGTYVLAGALARLPAVVESAYATGLGPLLARPLSLVTGLVPFALSEWCYVAYLTWIAVTAGRAVRSARARRRRWSNAAAAGGLRLARDAGVVLVAFHLLWGFNYARAPLQQRLGWADWVPPDSSELVAMATDLVDAGNLAYLAIHGVDDAGVPTALPRGVGGLRDGLQEGWRRAVDLLALPDFMGRRYGPAKQLLSSPIYARLGITGFYFPFTAEANVRHGIPAVSIPQSVAHEQAHQRGIASEDEASFLGYVTAALSTDPYARYAATMYAQSVFMNAVAAVRRDLWTALDERRLPGVRRDLDDVREYFRQFQGVGTQVGTAVNDRFLRANRVTGGIHSYSLAGRLLVEFGRVNGGTVVPAANPAP